MGSHGRTCPQRNDFTREPASSGRAGRRLRPLGSGADCAQEEVDVAKPLFAVDREHEIAHLSDSVWVSSRSASDYFIRFPSSST